MTVNEHYKYDVDYMRMLYDDDAVSVYELDAIHLGENPSGMVIDKECALNSLDSFADKPLYGVIDNQYDPLDSDNNDFMEHFREEYPWLITRDRILPFGCVPESALKDAKFVNRDGKTYLRMNVVVWKRLLPHVSEILQKRDGDVKVSVEFVILDAEQCPDTGKLYLHKFRIDAITVLGKKFKEVMDGCRIKAVKFSYNNYAQKCNETYNSYMSTNGVEIPEDVLSIMKDGICLREKCKRGGTKSVYNSMLAATTMGKVFDSHIEEAKKYFSSMKEIPEKTNPPTSKYILYNIFGGDKGREWFNSVDCNGSAVAIEKFSKGGSSEVNIQIDNKKDAAINGQGWENPGKALYDPILEAANKESLVKEAYLVVEDGWEDAPSEHLKYPHHEVKDGKLVLNVAGVKAAFARASQMDIVKGSVKEHLERHYRELGLSMENFEQKHAELKKQYDELNANFEMKCSECDTSNAALKAAETKCAELQAKLDEKCAEFEEKCAAFDKKCAEFDEMCGKMAELEKKDTIACNMSLLGEYCGCFDEETMNAMKKDAEELSKEDMEKKVSNAVMAFAKKAMEKDEREDKKFSFGFFNPNAYFDKSHKVTDPLEQVTAKYKTKVN